MRGKLQRGWRRYTFGYSKDQPKAVQVELCPRTSELTPMIETLEAEIARLNTLAVPEHTAPAGSVLQQSAAVPASSDLSAETLKNNDDTLEAIQQQQIDV